MKRSIAVLALLVTACATAPQPPANSLASSIDALLDKPPLQHALWSILIEEEDGRVLYARNADRLTMPASNRKLFTAATVASCLGTDARLVTEVWRDGDNLVLRGDGDPSLGSWRYERDGDFDRLADTLRARGITRVADVIADVSLFDRNTIPGSWKHGNLGADYAAPVDALTWGESEIPVDRSVPDPALYAATTLRDVLTLRGITVTGVARVNMEPRVWQERIATLPSPFVGDLLRTVLKNSHNLYAEMLLKRLSANGAQPATYENSFAIERAFLTSEPRVDAESFRFVDGSGLAPDDLLTCQSTIRVLRWMNDPSRRTFWWNVLAQPANEGTLRNRLRTLEERMRGKTGTIAGVNALSGILAMPDGRYRYFSIMINHHIADGSDATRVIDAIVQAASETSARTASATQSPASR
ncbi:MAG: D-alanyl-D-alanine carboxypeptidase [Acidobacteriota bacterium]|nr:D-alanyl-D-alanine carboxypeptidase [Acidobacteriota bacterium]